MEVRCVGALPSEGPFDRLAVVIVPGDIPAVARWASPTHPLLERLVQAGRFLQRYGDRLPDLPMVYGIYEGPEGVMVVSGAEDGVDITALPPAAAWGVIGAIAELRAQAEDLVRDEIGQRLVESTRLRLATDGRLRSLALDSLADPLDASASLRRLEEAWGLELPLDLPTLRAIARNHAPLAAPTSAPTEPVSPHPLSGQRFPLHSSNARLHTLPPPSWARPTPPPTMPPAQLGPDLAFYHEELRLIQQTRRRAAPPSPPPQPTPFWQTPVARAGLWTGALLLAMLFGMLVRTC